MHGVWQEAQQGGDVCVLTADSLVVQQKPIQHCNAIILLVEINFKKDKKSFLERKMVGGLRDLDSSPKSPDYEPMNLDTFLHALNLTVPGLRSGLPHQPCPPHT